MRTLLVPAAALAALVMAHAAQPTAAAAQGWIEPPPRFDGRFGVVKARSDVVVRVTGRVAHVEVEEWFENRGRGLGEGDYLYPLPGEAVFSGFSLFQGDEELTGETLDAERARAIYEEIVRRKRDPALIELAGHGLLRARVFPIAPGESRRIVLRYTQVLSNAGDALEFRYAAGVRRGPLVAHGRPAVELRGQQPGFPGGGAGGGSSASDTPPLSFRLTVDDGARFRDPFSPTHEVRITREAGGRMVVRPAGPLSGGFVLYLPRADRAVGVTLAAHRPAGEHGYFMLALSPGEARGATMPRDIVAVLDVSGSMSGVKIVQAKQALHQLLGTLDARDRFRLIAFSSGVSAHRPDWTPVSEATLTEARQWVDGLRAAGGTNIEGALAEAFRLASPEGRLPMVVFVTDGLPTVGERDPERLADRAERERGRARVFAFGVGYDVNTYLLDRLSEAARGSTQYVRPEQDVEHALGLLANRIRYPVLTDVRIAGSPVALEEIHPSELPDLFAGEELVLFGRYRAPRGAASGELAVTGNRAGRTERFAAAVTFPAHELSNDYIPRLWASRKLGHLMRSIRLHGRDAELVEEARALALRYGLISEFTAHLVLEPGEVLAGPGGRPLPIADMAAAEPMHSHGAVAVEAAEEARRRREMRMAADLDAAAGRIAFRDDAVDRRLVAGRIFRLRDGVWTDAGHKAGTRVVEVEPYGDAYFALLRLAPELRPYFAEFDDVLVAGAGVAFRVTAGGAVRIPDGELAELLRAFRGATRTRER